MIYASILYDANIFLDYQDACCMLFILFPKCTHMLEVLDDSAWSEESEMFHEFVKYET